MLRLYAGYTAFLHPNGKQCNTYFPEIYETKDGMARKKEEEAAIEK
jgi:hypothetical protein